MNKPLNPYQALHDKIREVGGIVHGDGNIFFTNAELLLKIVDNEVAAPQDIMQLQQDAYGAGFKRCADWARRDDLISDVGSPAYFMDMVEDIAKLNGVSTG